MTPTAQPTTPTTQGTSNANSTQSTAEKVFQFLDDWGNATMTSDPIPNGTAGSLGWAAPLAYGDNLIGLIAKGTGKAGKAITKVLTKADDVAKVAGKTGTVWDCIKATQPIIEGTNIPKSFVIVGAKVGEKELWVHPNATKHMTEYVTSKEFSHLKNMNEQAILTSFNSAVKEAIPQLTQEGRNFVTVGGWELGIDTATGVIYHALMK